MSKEDSKLPEVPKPNKKTKLLEEHCQSQVPHHSWVVFFPPLRMLGLKQNKST